MNAIAEKQESALAESNTVNMFERLARDPNIDVDKLQRLMEMQERILAKNAEAEFNSAMSRAQTAMRPVAADANNPQTRSKYASYAAIDKKLRPIYTEAGFALSFDTGEAKSDDCIRILCYVTHISGHSRTYHVDMPADGKGAKGGDVMTKTHAAGSAMSYGTRYLLKLIFNVAVGEDDDDGNGADRVNLTQDHQATITALVQEIDKTLLPKILTSYKAKTLAEIPDSEYASIVRRLEQRRKGK